MTGHYLFICIQLWVFHNKLKVACSRNESINIKKINATVVGLKKTNKKPKKQSLMHKTGLFKKKGGIKRTNNKSNDEDMRSKIYRARCFSNKY